MTIQEELNKKLATESELALRSWSQTIGDMLAQRYGKNKVGHVIIIFPYGRGGKLSWISDALRSTVVDMLRELADHIESPDAKIIRPS